MKAVRRVGLFVTVLCVAAVPAVCVAQGKVAVVQMDKVVRAFPEAQKAESDLKAVRDEYEKELEKMETKAKELQQAVEAAAAEVEDKALSDAEREKRREAARQKWTAFQEYQQKLRKTRAENQRDLSDQEMRQFKRIIGKLRDMISEYATDKKIDVVLDTAGVGVHGGPIVLFASDKIDITEEILKRVDAAAKASEKGQKKSETKE
jgi:Skp family chaperone for outer membrane proteins